MSLILSVANCNFVSAPLDDASQSAQLRANWLFFPSRDNSSYAKRIITKQNEGSPSPKDCSNLRWGLRSHNYRWYIAWSRSDLIYRVRDSKYAAQDVPWITSSLEVNANAWTFHEWSKTAVPRNREPHRSSSRDGPGCSTRTKKSCEADSSRSAILHGQRAVSAIEPELCLSMSTSVLVGQSWFWVSRNGNVQINLKLAIHLRQDCIVASSIFPSEWGTTTT